MIGDHEIQADLMTKIKSLGSITTGTSDIREFEWQGDEFTYPNIRLDLEDNRYEFVEQQRCSLQTIEFSVYIYSEMRSSKQCSYIKGLVANALIGLGFTGQYAKYTHIRLMENIPAIRVSEREFRSQLKLTTFVQNLN